MGDSRGPRGHSRSAGHASWPAAGVLLLSVCNTNILSAPCFFSRSENKQWMTYKLLLEGDVLKLVLQQMIRCQHAQLHFSPLFSGLDGLESKRGPASTAKHDQHLPSQVRKTYSDLIPQRVVLIVRAVAVLEGQVLQLVLQPSLADKFIHFPTSPPPMQPSSVM